MSEIVTDAIRYWEPRRILYNVILASIVIVLFMVNWPGSTQRITVNLMDLLFVLAVLANIAYCAAYVADVVVQASAFRAGWKRYRWTLFVVGLLFASILAQFFSSKMFGDAT